jgi:hypothetical protein
MKHFWCKIQSLVLCQYESMTAEIYFMAELIVIKLIKLINKLKREILSMFLCPIQVVANSC